MRERQPGGQLSGRLFWRLAVKGHHCGGHARSASELRTPPVADGHHFDLVRTPADVFFEMVNVHLFGLPPDRKSGAPVILRGCDVRSSETDHEATSTIRVSRDHRPISLKKNLRCQVVHKIFTRNPQVFHRREIEGVLQRHGVKSRMQVQREMGRILRGFVVLAFLALVPHPAAAGPDVTLFRLFLLDGSVLTSYGEFARVEDRVVFAMPVGGNTDQPRIQVASVRSALVDWPRTEKYSASARYQRYAVTNGEDDFRDLSNEVAVALNDVALSANRQTALTRAEAVRRTVAEWPATHYGYRQQDVREIVSVLDQAISTLRASAGAKSFEFALVATAEPPELEPVLGLPSVRQQLDELYHLASLSAGGAERVAILQAALTLINESSAVIYEASVLRHTTERMIRQELTVDRKYASLSQRVTADARRYAERAAISDIERLKVRIPKEDAKLGRQRPDMVNALNNSVEVQLNAARQLRLMRDQWFLRQGAYREYQRSVGSQLLLLVKSQASLDAIRRLEGPPPERLLALRQQLSGGAERLQRMRTPDHLRGTHDLLVGAWRFAENATKARFEAIEGANASAAWEASSAAAGALMMLSRVQQDLQALLEPPKLR